MKNRHTLFAIFLLGIMIVTGAGCHSDKGSPQNLLDRYFSSAIRQDYGTTYACYYKTYKAKVNKDEFIRHRREASVLTAYTVKSIREQGDAAQAEVELTFDKSQKLKRDHPVTALVKEDMVRENGEWKIKVW
ncbi:MAG TPA: hypothetical protein VF888_02790 [Nitrospirota bacterium]